MPFKTDNITYDLEDSVTEDKKVSARSILQDHLGTLSHRPSTIGELAVRINTLSSPYFEDDLACVASLPHLDTIVVPKVDRASDLVHISDILRQLAPKRYSHGEPVKLLALIESARAVMDLREICSATPDLDGLIFGAEDFAKDLSLRRSPDLTEFLYARGAIATAARSFELASTIDLVCTSYRGEDGEEILTREAENGLANGFNGKQCIHPLQVEPVQAAFSPSVELMGWAVLVDAKNREGERDGRGAFTVEGKMIDAPVVAHARAIIERAERCGFGAKIERLREELAIGK